MNQVDYSRDLCDQCGRELKMPTDPTQKPVHECGILDALLGWDWEAAFSFASGQAQGSCYGMERPEWAVAEMDKPEPFNRQDVAEIFGIAEGENDGPDWLVVGRLNSGLFFFLTAGCDYTGWDCQSGGRSYVARKREDLDLVTTIEEKQRLGLVPVEDRERRHMSDKFYGDAGVKRNPKVGAPVRMRQSPDVLGKIVEAKRDSTGATIWRVQWHSGPLHESWHPAEGLIVAEDIS